MSKSNFIQVLNYHQTVCLNHPVQKQQVFECLRNYCIAKNIEIAHYSDDGFLFDCRDFEKLKNALAIDHPNTFVWHSGSYRELLDFEFESSKSLSHFVLAWS